MNADSRGVSFFARLELYADSSGFNSVGACVVYLVDGSDTDTPVVSPLQGSETVPVPVGYITGGVDGQTVGVYKAGVIAVQGCDANFDPATIARGIRLMLSPAYAAGASSSAAAVARSSDDIAASAGSASIDAVACTDIPALDPDGPVGFAVVNFAGSYLSSPSTPPDPAQTVWDEVYATPLQNPQGFGGVGVLTDITGFTGAIPNGTMTLVSTTIRGQLYVQQEPGGSGGGPVLWRRLNGRRLAFLKANTAGPLLTPANSADGELTTTLDTSLAVAIGSNTDPLQDDVKEVFAFGDFGKQQWVDQLRTAEGTNVKLRVGNPASKTAECLLDAANSEASIAGREAGGTGAVLAVARAAGVSSLDFSDGAVAGAIEASIDAATNAVTLAITGATSALIRAGNGVVADVSKLSGSTSGCSAAPGAGAGTGATVTQSVVTPIGGHFLLTTGSAGVDPASPFAVVTIPSQGGRKPIGIVVNVANRGNAGFVPFSAFLTGGSYTNSTATAIYFWVGQYFADTGVNLEFNYVVIYES